MPSYILCNQPDSSRPDRRTRDSCARRLSRPSDSLSARVPVCPFPESSRTPRNRGPRSAPGCCGACRATGAHRFRSACRSARPRVSFTDGKEKGVSGSTTDTANGESVYREWEMNFSRRRLTFALLAVANRFPSESEISTIPRAEYRRDKFRD